MKVHEHVSERSRYIVLLFLYKFLLLVLFFLLIIGSKFEIFSTTVVSAKIFSGFILVLSEMLVSR